MNRSLPSCARESATKKIATMYWLVVFIQIPVIALMFRGSQELASGLYGAVDVAMFIYMLMCSRFRLVKSLRLRSSGVAVYLYLCWCLVSIAWSVSDSASYGVVLGFRDLLRVFICTLMVLFFGGDLARLIFLRAAVTSALVYAAMSLATMDANVDFSGAERYFYSDYKDSVGVARQAAVLCLLAISAGYAKVVSAKRASLGAVGCLLLMLMTFSKASLVALVTAVYLAYVIYGLSCRNLVLGTVALIAASALVYWFRGDYILAYLGASAGGETASGRFGIWEEVLKVIPGRLWVGYGINPISSLLDNGSLYRTPGTAHNDILQQLVSYGVVGVFLWFVMFFSYGVRWWECKDRAMKKLMSSFGVFFVILGLTESTLVLSLFPVYYIVLFMNMSITCKGGVSAVR